METNRAVFGLPGHHSLNGFAAAGDGGVGS